MGDITVSIELKQIARLEELGKPVTFILNTFGCRISSGAVVHAINVARLYGRAALHAECADQKDDPHAASQDSLMKEVRVILAVHALHEGELTAEASNPQPSRPGWIGGGNIFRIDVFCTDHPTQQDRTKPEGEPDAIDPNLPGYR